MSVLPPGIHRPLPLHAQRRRRAVPASMVAEQVMPARTECSCNAWRACAVPVASDKGRSMNNLTRRAFLQRAASAAMVLPLLAGCSVGPTGASPGGSATGEESTGACQMAAPARCCAAKRSCRQPFSVPLPIPPVLEPVRSDATTDYYEITQRVGPGRRSCPASRPKSGATTASSPARRSSRGAAGATVVRHRNELAVPTVVHLHGGKTPPEHDGYPTDMMMPVGGWDGGHGGQRRE